MSFSICIPIYNTEKYIERCLLSVIDQLASDDEIILVDDGSKDQAGVIADKFASQDKRVKVIHKKNQGLFLARISAMEVAKGDYIISLDSDDWFVAYAIDQIRELITKEDIDVLMFGYQVTDIDTGEIRRICKDVCYETKNTECIVREFLLSNRFNAIWRKVFKREHLRLDRMKNLPPITMTEDWIHSFFPMISASKIRYISIPLYNYSINYNGMSKNFDGAVYDSAKIRRRLCLDALTSKMLPVTQMEIEVQYLVSIAKMCAYTPGLVTNKESYYNFLKHISLETGNREIYSAYQNKLTMKYKAPLVWLFKGKYTKLFCIKKIVSYIRRKSGR